MRIISWLLLAGGVAGIGGAALAQSGTLPGRPLTPPVISGSWLPTHGFGRHHDFRRGKAKGPGRHHGRPGRHPGRFDGHRGGFDRDRFRLGRFGRGDAFVVAYGGVGSVEEFEAVEPHGNGFFAGGGGQVTLNGGRPYYDYDRSYPYEWASAARGGAHWVVDGAINEPERCTSERGVRVCRGR